MGFDPDELYPNQPLTDVAAEVRFCGDMQVECERHRFWDKIRDEYHAILVPYAEAGKSPALQHYRFRNAESGQTVSVALNSFAYSEAKYRGHKKFIAEFVRLARLFSETYPKISKLSRIGWRYINLMTFSREEGLLPLSRILKFHADLPLKMFEHSSSIDLTWASKLAGADVVLRLANVPRKEVPGQEALLLDIDYAVAAKDLSWDDVPDAVAKARVSGREIFESIISDSYRKYLRGESL